MKLLDKNGNALSPTEVLEGAVQKITDQYHCKKITLDQMVFSEIADDSDGHRNRNGNMCYESFIVLTGAGKRTWGLALGKKDNGYPGADFFESDLVAIDLTESFDTESKERCFVSKVQDGSYFQNTLLIGTVPGYLAANKESAFGANALSADLGDMLYNDAVKNKELITLGGNAIYEKAATYRVEAIDCVVGSIISVLEKR